MKKLFLGLVLALLIVGCKKESVFRDITIKNQVKNGPIPSYVFDWETSTYMPSAPGNNNQVQMPWNSGTTSIDPNIVSDYKKYEGWELAYNTFGPTVQLGDPNYTYFFALYNRYRGVLRFYLWQPASAIATSYVTHGLSLYKTSGTSPMLNFDATDVVAKANQEAFVLTQQQQINSAGGTWFAFQYEIAYDPNLNNTSFPNMGLTWSSSWANVSSVLINGTSTGQIKGTVGNPASTFDFGSTLQKGALNILGEVGYAAYLEAVNSQFQPPPNTPQPTNPYLKAISNGLLGIVKGFLGGILGLGSSGSTMQKVDLMMKSDIKLNGQIVANGGIQNLKLALPGQLNNATANGNIPAYNEVMGVFTVSNAPVINLHINEYGVDIGDPYYGSIYTTVRDKYYTFESSSFNIIWNPAIINSSPTGATINDVKKEIIQLMPNRIVTQWGSFSGGYIALNPNSSVTQAAGAVAPCIWEGNAVTEVVGREIAAVRDADQTLRISVDSNHEEPRVTGIRLSFDVIPNDGSPKYKIIKTFEGNIIQN